MQPQSNAERRRDRSSPASITIAPGGTAGPCHGACRRERRSRRGLRLPAAAPRRHRPEGPVRDARHAAGAGASADPAAAAVPDGRHAQGRLARLGVPLSRCALRPAAELRRHAGERGRRRAALPDPDRRAGCQRRRRRDLLFAGLPGPPVVARLAGRERRPGIRRHSRQRQQPDARLPARHRRRGDGLPAHEGVLRRGRLGPRPVHGTLARRRIPAPRLGERRAAAAPRSDHEPRRGRPADACARASRSRCRGRSVLARDRLRPGARRRRGL